MSNEATPIPAHLGPEFLLWLWWRSERDEGRFDLDKPVGRVSVWVDERLAFRRPSDQKVTAVLTGENPSTTPEARAALAEFALRVPAGWQLALSSREQMAIPVVRLRSETVC